MLVEPLVPIDLLERAIHGRARASFGTLTPWSRVSALPSMRSRRCFKRRPRLAISCQWDIAVGGTESHWAKSAAWWRGSRRSWTARARCAYISRRRAAEWPGRRRRSTHPFCTDWQRTTSLLLCRSRPRRRSIGPKPGCWSLQMTTRSIGFRCTRGWAPASSSPEPATGRSSAGQSLALGAHCPGCESSAPPVESRCTGAQIFRRAGARCPVRR